MYHILDLKGKDEFELERVSYIADAKGDKRMVCDYSHSIGPKSSLKVMFEGFCKADVLRLKKTFTLKSLMTMFDDRRIYLQGVLFLDGQFDENQEVQ